MIVKRGSKAQALLEVALLMSLFMFLLATIARMGMGILKRQEANMKTFRQAAKGASKPAITKKAQAYAIQAFDDVSVFKPDSPFGDSDTTEITSSASVLRSVYQDGGAMTGRSGAPRIHYAINGTQGVSVDQVPGGGLTTGGFKRFVPLPKTKCWFDGNQMCYIIVKKVNDIYDRIGKNGKWGNSDGTNYNKGDGIYWTWVAFLAPIDTGMTHLSSVAPLKNFTYEFMNAPAPYVNGLLQLAEYCKGKTDCLTEENYRLFTGACVLSDMEKDDGDHKAVASDRWVTDESRCYSMDDPKNQSTVEDFSKLSNQNSCLDAVKGYVLKQFLEGGILNAHCQERYSHVLGKCGGWYPRATLEDCAEGGCKKFPPTCGVFAASSLTAWIGKIQTCVVGGGTEDDCAAMYGCTATITWSDEDTTDEEKRQCLTDKGYNLAELRDYDADQLLAWADEHSDDITACSTKKVKNVKYNCDGATRGKAVWKCHDSGEPRSTWSAYDSTYPWASKMGRCAQDYGCYLDTRNSSCLDWFTLSDAKATGNMNACKKENGEFKYTDEGKAKNRKNDACRSDATEQYTDCKTTLSGNKCNIYFDPDADSDDQGRAMNGKIESPSGDVDNNPDNFPNGRYECDSDDTNACNNSHRNVDGSWVEYYSRRQSGDPDGYQGLRDPADTTGDEKYGESYRGCFYIARQMNSIQRALIKGTADSDRNAAKSASPRPSYWDKTAINWRVANDPGMWGVGFANACRAPRHYHTKRFNRTDSSFLLQPGNRQTLKDFFAAAESARWGRPRGVSLQKYDDVCKDTTKHKTNKNKYSHHDTAGLGCVRTWLWDYNAPYLAPVSTVALEGDLRGVEQDDKGIDRPVINRYQTKTVDGVMHRAYMQCTKVDDSNITEPCNSAVRTPGDYPSDQIQKTWHTKRAVQMWVNGYIMDNIGMRYDDDELGGLSPNSYILGARTQAELEAFINNPRGADDMMGSAAVWSVLDNGAAKRPILSRGENIFIGWDANLDRTDGGLCAGMTGEALTVCHRRYKFGDGTGTVLNFHPSMYDSGTNQLANLTPWYATPEDAVGYRRLFVRIDKVSLFGSHWGDVDLEGAGDQVTRDGPSRTTIRSTTNNQMEANWINGTYSSRTKLDQTDTTVRRIYLNPDRDTEGDDASGTVDTVSTYKDSYSTRRQQNNDAHATTDSL